MPSPAAWAARGSGEARAVSIRLTRSEKAFSAANAVLLVLLSLLFLYPFWYVIVLSLNEGIDAARGGISWWPRAFTVGNYAAVLSDSTIVRAFLVSVLRTVIGTAGSILVTAMVAFGLSRRELPGRGPLITVFFVVMLFGGGLIPYYLQLQRLGLLNHFAVYVVPGLFSVWNMIVMKTYFKANVPESIVESARMDGAGYARVFFELVLPLCVPLLAALSLFTAVGHWNDWFTGAFFVSDTRLQPLQTYLQRVMSTTEAMNMVSRNQLTTARQASLYNPSAVTTRSLRMATIMVATLPILLVYPFLQGYFVKGVLIGSIKE
jgi:putative aldouronate transport system permease protein